MYRSLYFLVLVLSLVSCDFSKKNSIITQPGTRDSLVQKGAWGYLAVEYPVYKNAFADTVISDHVKNMVNDFRSYTKQEDTSDEWGYEMEVSYEEFFAKPGIVSVVFNIYQFTGGAHGNTFIASDVLDTQNNRVLKLKDIIAQADFKKLQEFVRKNLKRQLDFHEFINDGTEKWNDFSSFAVTDSTIIFWFSPYQVAPYSYGIQKVVVPKNVLGI